MNFFLDSALLGLEYALLAIGVYITFRILNLPDLTVDGSFTFGMAVSTVLCAAAHPFAGLLACVSVSNTQLGERSAEMAYDILNGKDVSEVPAEAMSDFQYVCSRAAADALSITLPEDGSVTLIGG